MSADEWERVRLLFEGALAVAARDRPSWIEQQAPSESVAREVRELIVCYEQWPDFLEEQAAPTHAPDDVPPPSLTGRRLGPWRLEREIGRGGMGVVWEGVRADGSFQQRVAIKLLPAGVQSLAGIARFVEERQILANLSHPGIARLLDGGSMEDGTPYLAMEFVEGERLDDWLADGPPFDERLRVFLSICAAVEFAHRHLTVHGDLKPANIMVTPRGDAVLLDFGVAKLLSAGPGRVAGTRTRLFSPRFASPEQVCGRPVTTATDVHALGVLLYLLLSERQPFANGSEDSLAVMQAICAEEPAPPSTAPVAWRKALRGELDAIVLQCLRKNPEERYGSVVSLEEDLAAWREGRPVSAHRPGWARRATKLMGRNKSLSGAIGLAVLFLIGGSGVSLWQAHLARQERTRAEMRFQQVKGLAHSVLFDLHDAIERLPGSTAARRLLVQEALDYLRDLEATGGNDRDLDLQLAAAYMRVGNVQSSMGGANTGDSAAALESQLRARRLTNSALRAHPRDERATRQLLDIDRKLADIYEQQANSAGWRDLRAEIEAMSASLAARHPRDRTLRFWALWDKAFTLGEEPRPQENLAAWRDTLAAARDALAVQPGDPGMTRFLARCYRNLGDAYKYTGNRAAALEGYQQALAIDERRAAADPAAAQPKMDLYWDLVPSGWVHHNAGDSQTAVTEFEWAASLLRQVCAADPDDFLARLELAKLLVTAVPAWQALGREEQVTARLQEALRCLEWARARDPHNQDAQLHYGWALVHLGDACTRRNRWQAAAENYAQGLAALRGIPPGARFDEGVGAGPIISRATSQMELCRLHLENLPRR